MSAPLPKYEVMAEVFDHCIVFHTASNDAIMKVSGSFAYGKLFPMVDGNTYVLYVSPMYDMLEVAHYIAGDSVFDRRLRRRLTT